MRAFLIWLSLCLACGAAENKRIPDLDETVTPASGDYLVIVPVGDAAHKITFSNLTAGLGGGGTATNKTLFVYDISTNQIPAGNVTNAGDLIFHNITDVIVPSQLRSAAYQDISVFVLSPTNNPLPGDIIRFSAGTNHAWVAPATLGYSTGTVTSVSAAGPTGFTWSSPVTGSGTLTATTPGLVVTNGFRQPLTVSNNFGVTGSATFGLATGTPTVIVTDGSVSFVNGGATVGLDGSGFFNGGISTPSSIAGDTVTAGSSISVNAGAITLFGDGSAAFAGGAATIQTDGGINTPHSSLSSAGGASFVDGAIILGPGIQATTLAGTGNRLVQADASGVQSATIDVASLGSGTVTSVGASGPAGFTWSSAVTSSGTLTATTPGLVLTNGHNQAIVLSNTVTFRDAANNTATITNGVLSAVVTATTLTNAGATASALVVSDANKKAIGLANGGAGTYLEGTTPPAYSSPPGLRTWAGNTGNALIAAATTVFYAPNGNSHTNMQGADVATFTRNLVTRSTTLTNLYCKLSAAPGASRDCTIVVMTNGVASNLQTVVSAANTTGNSGSLSVPIIAGDEFGIRIVTVASATATKISWALEGR